MYIYIDWSITTPTMLMAYLNGEATLTELWCRNKEDIVLDWVIHDHLRVYY